VGGREAHQRGWPALPGLHRYNIADRANSGTSGLATTGGKAARGTLPARADGTSTGGCVTFATGTYPRAFWKVAMLRRQHPTPTGANTSTGAQTAHLEAAHTTRGHNGCTHAGDAFGV
jgi:hypothetical protein